MTLPRSLDRGRARLLALVSLDGRLAFLQRPGIWWWVALGVGAALRVLFVSQTTGSYDAVIWERFARSVSANGLFQEYHRTAEFNHPPPISMVAAGLYWMADAMGVPFALTWRLPFALLDAVSATLLFRLCGERKERYLVTAVYWLSPLALVYSSFHGNTDSAIGFCLLLAVYFIARGHPLAAAAVMGATTWIKLPGLIALPALGFAQPTWKARFAFGSVAGGVALLGYAPAIVLDPAIVVERVLQYGGQIIRTTGDVHVWGIIPFYPTLFSLPEAWHPAIKDTLYWYHVHTQELCLGLIVLVAYTRREARELREVARTVTLSCAVLYGLSSFWSFQYLAWSLPLWFLSPIRFAAPALALGSLYIYGLYAWLTGHPLLLGKWDFLGNPIWPEWIEWARNATYLFFLAIALSAIASALVGAYRDVRGFATRRL